MGLGYVEAPTKISGTQCCLRLSNPQAYSAAGRIWLTNKIQWHHWEWNSTPVHIITRAHLRTFLKINTQEGYGEWNYYWCCWIWL